jgi:hypothetical protein
MGSSPQSGSANIPVDIDISIRLKPEVWAEMDSFFQRLGDIISHWYHF